MLQLVRSKSLGTVLEIAKTHHRRVKFDTIRDPRRVIL